jgi:hypothetical protein
MKKAARASKRKLPTAQSRAFVEAATAAECDDDEAQFEKRLKAVVKAGAKASPKEKQTS